MSGNLQNQRIRQTFGRLLQIANGNDGADGELRPILDGKGDVTPLMLSTLAARINGQLELGADPTAAGNAVTRGYVDARARSPSPLDYASLRDGDDWLPCFNAAFADSRQVYVPRGTFDVSDAIRLDGPSGGLSDGYIFGEGYASHIRKMAYSDITTASGQRSSPITALSGARHAVRDLRIEGNMSRGGLTPPYCINWAGAGTNYTIPTSGNPRIVSSAPDGTVASPRTAADRIFILLVAHTASANIETDLALGRWMEVTDQPWDELTGEGYLNSYTLDDDFAWRHGVYMNGLASPVMDCQASQCFVTDTVYGGILIGKGPLFADLQGFGAERAKIFGNVVYNTGATCIGGGGSIKRAITNNTCFGSDSSLIRCDEGSNENTVASNILIGVGPDTNGAISIFKSNDIQITGNQGYDSAIGLTATNCDRLTTSANHWEANGTGVSLRDVDDFQIGGDVCLANTNGGFKLSRGTGSGAIVGLQTRENGSFGLEVDDAAGLSLVGVVSRRNASDNIRLNNMRSSSVIGCQAWDAGFGAGTAETAGIQMIDCVDVTVMANRCGDTRSGLDRTQQYGIRETGTSSGSIFVANQLKGNGTLGLSMVSGAARLFNDLTAPAMTSATTLEHGAGNDMRFRMAGTLRGVLTQAGTWVFGGDVGVDTMRVTTTAAPQTYTQISPGVSGVAGGAPNITVVAQSGGPASADLRLTPLGTAGRVRFGAYTVDGAMTAAGYIEIKDSAGTVRKLMVAS